MHILITRFNLDYNDRVPKNLGLQPNEWLEHRVELFFDFCYPSIINQSNKGFQWWVYFDSKTPKSTLDEIKKRDFNNIIQIKLCDSWGDFRGDILRDLNTLPKNYDYLINSRIDSDDALGKDTIKKTQEYAKKVVDNNPERGAFSINPLKGIVFEKESGMFFSKKLKSNPFLSLVIPKDESNLSVFTYQHQQVQDETKYFDLKGNDFWLQVVHGKNWLNRISGRPFILSKEAQKRLFNCEYNSNRNSLSQFVKAYWGYLKRMKIKFLNKLSN